MKKTEEEIIVEYFQENPTAFLKEISQNTGFSKSKIQRVLQSKGSILLFSTGKTIQQQLEENKLRGRSIGGKNTFSLYDVVRREDGTIIGSKKTKTLDKVEKKEESIRFICDYYLENPNLTLEELSNMLEEVNLYQKSFVFHCLRDASTADVIGEEKYRKIQNLLDQKRYSFFRKMGDNRLMNYIDQAPLSPMERAILLLRLHHLSLEDVARDVGLSKTAVAGYEDRAIALLKRTIEKGQKK